MKPLLQKLICLGALALLAFGPSASSAAENSIDPRHLPGFGDVRYHRLESKLLERGFHVYVRLPESYADKPDERFPTVYLLDGGVTFPLLAAYYRYLSLARELPDLVVVGISYGAVDWREGNMRGVDFTAPSVEREHWGGAARFQEVLKEELLPLIEARYRSDPRRRIIFGQSLGGQFVLFTALEGQGLFWGHIASNPALHRNLKLFLRKPPAADGGSAQPRPRVYVSSGEHDVDRFRQPALEWMKHWTGRNDAGWSLRTETLEGHGHFSAAPAAFRNGLRWLFEAE